METPDLIAGYTFFVGTIILTEIGLQTLFFGTDLPFAVNSSVTEGKRVMKVQGRVDTLTATRLLKTFQEASHQTNSIELDVEKMPYISSAGLRVLLIMRKSVKDPSCFKLFHVQPAVEKVLKITGFDRLLLV